MARGDDIEERLIDFAVMVIALCEKMPETRAGRHVAGQLVRSGTSPAPQYGEARGAESRRDFVHKLRICLKELNESRIWLEIAKRSNMASLPKLQPSSRRVRRALPHHQRQHPNRHSAPFQLAHSPIHQFTH
jgi:four helix bundle protein